MNKLLSSILLLACTSMLSGCKKEYNILAAPNFSVTGGNKKVLETQNALGDTVNITPYLEIFTGNTNAAAHGNLIPGKDAVWQNCGGTILPGFFNEQGFSWFRVTLQNNGPDVFKRLVCFTDFDRVDFDYFSAKPEKGGELVPLKEWSYASDNHCLYMVLNGNQTKTYYIKCYRRAAAVNQTLQFVIRSEQNEQSYQAYEIRSRMADTAFLFFYLGFLFFAFTYFLFQFLYRSTDRLLLIYSLYVLFTLLYSVRDIDKHYFLKTAFPFFNGINSWGEAIFSYLSYIFYLLFVLYLLNLKVKRKWAYGLINSTIAVMTFLLICDVLFRLTGNEETAVQIFIKARMIIFPLAILYFLLVIPLWKGYYKYFLYGSLFLMFGAGISLLVFLVRNSPSFIFHEAISSSYRFWGNTVNYTRLGVLAEIAFFSLGLSKKLQVDYAQSAILNLNNNYTSIIFHEIKNGLNKLIGLFKSKSSNSINFIHQLSEILSDSLEINEAKISLTDELIIAERYFNFRLKLNQKIDLKIINDASTSLDKIIVPPMLLQPFIENCLKHAFADEAQEEKEITVHIVDTKKFVTIEIKDNGVGFKNGIANMKSKGTKLIRDRLDFFNDLFGTNIYFETGNREDAPGAMVTIYNLQKNNL